MDQPNALPLPRQAILLESRGDPELLPLIEQRPLSLLPVGGKPIIQYWCEQLNQAGFNRLHLVVSHYPDQIRQLVGGGERWGLEITLTIAPEGSDRIQLLRLASHRIGEPTLVAMLDQLPVRALDQALAEAVTVEALGEEEGYAPASSIALITPDSLEAMMSGGPFRHHPFASGVVMPVTTPLALWQANQDLLADRIYDPLPPGFESDPGIDLEIGVQLRPGIRFRAPCSIGRNTLVMPRTAIGPGAVIGANCIISEASSISESVVFDHTLVGSHTALDRVIADGRLIYAIDHGVATWIDDPAIIGSNLIPPPRVGLFDRLLAAILLLLLLPALLLFTLWRRVEGSESVESTEISLYSGRDLAGVANYRPLRLYLLVTDHPGWRRVPWLVAVLRGDLRLVGVTVEPAADQPPPPDWAREIAGQLPGLITLHDLSPERPQGEEGRYISDSYYLATRTLAGDLRLIWRWLLRLLGARGGQTAD